MDETEYQTWSEMSGSEWSSGRSPGKKTLTAAIPRFARLEPGAPPHAGASSSATSPELLDDIFPEILDRM